MPLKGFKHSEEAKAKMGLVKIGKKRGPLSEETKAKLSLAKKGRKTSEETKVKMRLAHKGKALPLEHRMNSILGMKRARAAKRAQNLFNLATALKNL
jgi:hypothetical protein